MEAPPVLTGGCERRYAPIEVGAAPAASFVASQSEVSMRRFGVSKRGSARKFSRQMSRTKVINVARGGFRL